MTLLYILYSSLLLVVFNVCVNTYMMMCNVDKTISKVTLANGSPCTSHKTRLFPPHNNYSKILLLLKILPIIVLWCRIARNLILRLWNMPFKKFEENTCYYYYYYLTITLMLSLYERFSCQFSEIKKWYT